MEYISLEFHFFIPIPALRAHVGKHIQSGTRRGGPFIVDARSYGAPASQGGHIQRDHSGICSTISDGLREAQCPHLGAGTQCSCKVSRNSFPRVTDETAMRNGIIPDLVLLLGHLSHDEHSLDGCDHLADTKTLNASKQHYLRNSTDFGFAVSLRQTEVKSEYRKHAEKLDA
jgi:hypothetical protein